MVENEGKIFVVDTNVFIYDPEAVEVLRKDGNRLIVPLAVILELDNLKTKPEKGLDAREAIRMIDESYKKADTTLEIADRPPAKYLKGLDKNNSDHQIAATAKMIASQNGNGPKVSLISRDRTVRILAKKIGVQNVEDYRHNRVDIPRYSVPKTINVSADDQILDVKKAEDHYTFRYFPKKHGTIIENEGVICYSNLFGEWGKSFAAIRKGDIFQSVPNDINTAGLRPLKSTTNSNGEPNWGQYLALAHLLNPDVQLVFLQGGAGTGKTLLAVAAAIGLRSNYQQIVITRPMVHLEDEDRLGFLPGDLEQKMAPWKKPILQAFSFLGEIENGGGRKTNEETIKKMLENDKIVFEPLDYIRGMTYNRDILIVDEAQNLTPHQVKTIITRAGFATKMIFTGDLSQIDRKRRIDERSSGLAYAMNKMMGNPLVAIVNFLETVRSPLASLAEELL